MTENQVGASKASAIWAATGLSFWLESIGITGWGDVAAILAAVYSLLLIIKWFKQRSWRRKDDE